jgi:lysophospholipase L1-like esterase
LETDDAGFVYHNMGINGAATASFLRCNRMAMELKSLKPDLVIFGIGINDAYGNNFNSSLFETNYDSLVSIVKASNPNVAIIFLTNNDSYYRKRYLNKNGLQVQQSMYNLAKKHQAAVWDLFEIMGGLNSIVAWQKSYLAKKDRIHFTGTGYLLLGDLLYDAVMQNYGDYLGQQYDAMKLEANLKIAE